MYAQGMSRVTIGVVSVVVTVAVGGRLFDALPTWAAATLTVAAIVWMLVDFAGWLDRHAY